VAPTTPGNLAPEEWATMVELVRLIKDSAPDGAQALPSDLAPVIEDSIRSYFIENQPLQTVVNIFIMSTVDLLTGGICQ
jgi:hypothetical protein